jgi:hypothetical protein
MAAVSAIAHYPKLPKADVEVGSRAAGPTSE